MHDTNLWQVLLSNQQRISGVFGQGKSWFRQDEPVRFHLD